MGVVSIRPAAEIRVAAEAAFEEHRRRVLELLPEVQVVHVGATSIPGALTKGDVDLLVRVDAARFAAAVAALRGLYAVHQPENWTPTYASFAGPEATDLPVGVQLAVAGSADDLLFGPFRDALIGDPALLAEYNALKLRYDGHEYARYTEAKGEFVERVLARAKEAGRSLGGGPAMRAGGVCSCGRRAARSEDTHALDAGLGYRSAARLRARRS